MKYLPGIAVNELNGTLKGVTAQRWRGLGVFRKKPTPHNPMTPRQTDVRIITAQIAEAWREELNQGQRTAWNQRAKNYPWKDVFGREIAMTGLNLYVKLNFPLIDFGLPKNIEPPPMTEPPELDDVILDPDINTMFLAVPQITPAIQTAQAPFIDLKIAGGWFVANISEQTPNFYLAELNTEALPQGRVHQKADFVHALYLADTIPAEPPGEPNNIAIAVPFGATRNVTVSLKRFNKFGNFSTERIFSKIITGV